MLHTNALAATLACASVGAEPDDLSSLLAGACDRFDVPALAAAVVSTDGIQAIGVAGVLVQGAPLKADLNDRFHIGSCTKAMTAVLLAAVVQEHEAWTLDSTLSEIYPELEGELNEVYAGVTLRKVLAHEAGLPQLIDGSAPDRVALEGLPDDPREARAAFTHRLLTAQAGTPEGPAGPVGVNLYSNAGYGVAAAIAEKLADESWESLMRSRLFGPLGMSEAGFGWPATPATATEQPRGHLLGLAGLTPHDIDPEYTLAAAIDPAGDAHASIAGWAAFAQDRLAAHTGAASALLDAQATADLVTPSSGMNYAGGWIVADAPNLGVLYAHDGSAGTFYSTVILLPEHDKAILVATNSGAGGEACGAIRDLLIGRYVIEPQQAETPSDASPNAPE